MFVSLTNICTARRDAPYIRDSCQFEAQNDWVRIALNALLQSVRV